MDLQSCFHEVVVKEHISLLPCFVGKLSEGIVEHLNCKVLKYSTDLKGVLLSYSKPTVTHNRGLILDELPHIHLDFTYTGYIFRPALGSVLCGVVNKVGIDHVGCLLYDCFNVTVISLETSQCNTSNRFPFGLEEGSIVWFGVLSLDITRDSLSLTGNYFEV